MRIECPACHSAYDIPPTLLASGRPVRCLRCGHSWRPAPEDPAPKDPTPEAPAPETPAPPPPPKPPAPPRVSLPDRLDATPRAPLSTPAPTPAPDAAPDSARPPPGPGRPASHPLFRAGGAAPLAPPPTLAGPASRLPGPSTLAAGRPVPTPEPPAAPAAPTAATPLAPWVAWGASVVVVAGALALLLVNHAAISAAWPPAGHLFRALGLS